MSKLSGQITVTTAGTAVAGPAAGVGSYFVIKAHPDNAGTVWFGNDGAGQVLLVSGGMMRRNNRMAFFARPGYPQIVANAGVEVGEAAPEDWFYSLQNTEWANQGHNGNRSLRINVANAMADWRTSLFPVVGGRRYRVGVWLKGASTPQVVLAARWFSDVGGANYITEEWLVLNGVFVDWTINKHIIQTPANAVTGDLMFRAAFNTTADVYGDDFTVRRVN